MEAASRFGGRAVATWLDDTLRLEGLLTELHAQLTGHPDVVYLYLAAVLIVAVVVELLVRGESAASADAKQAEHEVSLSPREIAELRSEIDGIEDEDIMVEAVADVTFDSIASLAEFDPEEVGCPPMGCSVPGGSDTTEIRLSDTFHRHMQFRLPDCRPRTGRLRSWKTRTTSLRVQSNPFRRKPGPWTRSSRT